MSELERLLEENHRLRAELDAVKRREAAMTEALLDLRVRVINGGEGGSCWCEFKGERHSPRCLNARAALSPDAGKDLFTRAQLLPVAQALQLVWDAATLNEGDGPADLDASMIFKAMCRLRAIGLLDAPLP